LNTKKKVNFKLILIILLGLALVLPAGWILIDRMEGQAPEMTLDLKSPSLGKSQVLKISVGDTKSGIRRLWIGLVKEGKEIDLLKKSFPSAGFFSGGMTRREALEIPFEPEALGLTDGKAILRLTLWDYSWRKWGRGNRYYEEKEILIDTKLPQIELVSQNHNINQGGCGLAVYRLSEACPRNGVVVGENFFPGFSGYFEDDRIHLAFFALNYQQGPDTKIHLEAVDFAGNTQKKGFAHHVNARKFKRDVINLSDRFLGWKMPEFDNQVDGGASLTPIEKFLQVNRKMRADNAQTIYNVSMDSEKRRYWQGTFLRLPKSANRAGFADHRKYRYNGKTIDEQVHLGVDLASTAHSPIPAANAGKVVLAESVGIYGNTVIIDHGFSLMSLYGHLSSIGVQVGQVVARGEIIGRTGTSGMAGGDHLHFSMLVYNTYVNPIEWWDQNWIKNNITVKLESSQAKRN
jgi:murein DD-endopeptidase MepM/ murein hydrolase activator NlpD